MLDCGCRVRLGTDRGTVRYVGTIDDSDQVWYCIEWDTPRGRHDGSVHGTRFFECAPLHGSFVRAASPLVTGTSFLTALREKYGDSCPRTAALTGAAPPPALPSPSAVDVATPGPPGEIAAACPHLRTADLSRSLLATWRDAACIAAQPPLTHLILHETRLMFAPDAPLPHLTHLGLNAAAHWDDVARIAPTLPALTSLDLAGNAIDTLTPAPLAVLRTLNLGSNALASWPDVCEALGHLPALERLVLTDNRIAHIPLPPIHHTYFPQLHSISLIDNPIAAWRDLEALEQWMHRPLALSVGRGAFLEHLDERTARAETIARLASLAELNHTPITSAERTEAERYYVYLARERNSSPQDTRLAELARVHDMPLAQHTRPATLDQKLTRVRTAALARAPDAADAPRILADELTEIALLRTMPLRLATRRVAASCGVAAHEAAGAHMYGIFAPPAPNAAPLVTPLESARTLEWYGFGPHDVLVLVLPEP